MNRCTAVQAASLVCVLAAPASRATAQGAPLRPGERLEFEYRSAVFGEVVARATLALDAPGTALTAAVQVVPGSTFLPSIEFATAPLVVGSVVRFSGYRSVALAVPDPGYNFALAFGGDPGLGGSATAMVGLAAPAPAGFVVDGSAVRVYGFRGDRVPNDFVRGTLAAVVPEPSTYALTGVGVLALGGAAARRVRGRS